MKIFLLFIILLVSCRSNNVINNDEQLSSNPNLKATTGEFREFWNNFGKALRDNDTTALDKYLDTTVFLYGREDEDPKFLLYNRDRIIKVREIYLTGGTYDYQNDTNISYTDFFLSKNALNREYVEGEDNQAIEDFVFKKNKWDEWKLIGVYSDTKNLQK